MYSVLKYNKYTKNQTHQDDTRTLLFIIVKEDPPICETCRLMVKHTICSRVGRDRLPTI